MNGKTLLAAAFLAAAAAGFALLSAGRQQARHGGAAFDAGARETAEAVSDPALPPAAVEAQSRASLPSNPAAAQTALQEALAEKDAWAAALAEANTVEATERLLQAMAEEKDWHARAVLSRNLRALGNPETLQALLPALIRDYGRGSPVTSEIIDAIARMAQEDTVFALEALHWQASGGVESMKVVRAVASIRNPAARRALIKLARNPDAAESLRVAAEEAVRDMGAP